MAKRSAEAKATCPCETSITNLNFAENEHNEIILKGKFSTKHHNIKSIFSALS